MKKQGDISVYKRYDPDTIYEDGSMTFFYVPQTNNLFIAPYPQAHHDMLADNDDLFRDVYHNQTLNSRNRRELSSRGQALIQGRAILGRLAVQGDGVLIAFWPNPLLNTQNVGLFLKALYKKFPNFGNFQSKTVLILPGKQPITVADLLGTTAPERAVTLKKPKKSPNKQFTIGGRSFTLSDLQSLRAALHSNNAGNPGLGDPRAVLCHPDMDSYPELQGYKPSSCEKIDTPLRNTHPQNWRIAGRNNNLPYLYTHEHVNFRDFFDIRHSLGL